MKILAVANRDTVRTELSRELSALFPEAEIIEEANALMAGKYAFIHPVDLVFAEAEMKRMNGPQLIRFIRQECPAAKGFLIGTEQALSACLPTDPEEVAGSLIYPFTEKAIRDAVEGSRK